MTGCAVPFGRPGSYAGQVMTADSFDSATYWLDAALQQVRDSRMAPPRAAYCFAAPMVAGFIAANAVSGAYEDNFGIGPAPVGANPEVAYGAAFATAASETFLTPMEFQRLTFFARFPDNGAKSTGEAWGRKIGLHINKMRTFDGSGMGKISYYFGDFPHRNDVLQWEPTAQHYATHPGPAFDDYQRGLFPGQGRITPWSITSAKDYRLPPFYDPRSPEFAEEFHLLRTIGGSDSQERTADQTEIAIFWEDGPWGITPPGHMLQIAMQLAAIRGFGFLEKARLYALMAMGQCDAGIVCWYNKYIFDILRPETAIRRRAGRFNNADPRVVADPHWQTVINTPNFPSYSSGHSMFGATGVGILERVLGGDEVRFSQQSPDQVIWPVLRGRTRHFTSLRQVADENGLSRIYGGVHWLRDHQQSMIAGQALADHINATFFKARG
jgi:hypothetical protein